MSRRRHAADDAAEAQAPRKRARSTRSPAVGSAAANKPLAAVPFGSTLRLGDLVDFALPGHAYQLGQVISVQPRALNISYLDRDGARTCAVVAPDSSDLAPPLSHSSLRNRAQAKLMLEHLLAQEQADPQTRGETVVYLQGQLKTLPEGPRLRPSSLAAANRVGELEARVVQLESDLRQSREQFTTHQGKIAQLKSYAEAVKPAAAYKGKGTVLLDSGATHHCCNDRRLFRSLRKTPPHSIVGFSGEFMMAHEKGEIVLTLITGGQLVLADVWFSEQFKDTLISVPQLASVGFHTAFDDKHAILTKNDTVCVVVRRENKYLFDLCSPGSQ